MTLYLRVVAERPAVNRIDHLTPEPERAASGQRRGGVALRVTPAQAQRGRHPERGEHKRRAGVGDAVGLPLVPLQQAVVVEPRVDEVEGAPDGCVAGRQEAGERNRTERRVRTAARVVQL